MTQAEEKDWPPLAPQVSDRSPLPIVRKAVRELLLSSAAFHSLNPKSRLEIAHALVKVCNTAASLIREETESIEVVGPAQSESGVTTPKPTTTDSLPPLAAAQSAASEFSGVAAERVAGTTRSILNAVSFPRFVTELINGVFKAIIDSNRQQMDAYVDLLKNVAASTEGFADANLGPDRARQWLVERYPGSFEVDGSPDEDTDPRDREEEAQEARLRLRPGASMPPESALRTDLGLAQEESVPSGDPENTLVPFARRSLARQRQQVLATMVMLGMQRIVIESGRLHASMRFHIDTRSAAQEDKASQFDIRNTLTASGSFGFGPWGASATMTNTIGYVSTQKTQTTEEMNTDLDLSSSVELVFKTDYVPLDRFARSEQRDRIRVNTLNPEAEAKALTDARIARERRMEASESARRSAPGMQLPQLPEQPRAPKPGEPGSREAAEKERKQAQKGTGQQAAQKGQAIRTEPEAKKALEQGPPSSPVPKKP